MVDNKSVGVVIVNYHTDNDAINAVEMYLRFSSIDKIVIVNNDCEKSKIIDDKFSENEQVMALYFKDNLGYSKGNNRGIEYLLSQGIDYIIISNSDVSVDNNAIEFTVKKLINNPEFGAMAPRMKNFDGTLEPFRYIELGLKRFLMSLFVRNLDLKQQNKIVIKDDVAEQSFLPGSFFVVSSDAMKKVCMFDEKVFLYREEEILGQRFIQAGFKEGVITTCYFNHNHDFKSESIKTRINREKLMRKSEKVLFGDYYNYNSVQMKIVVLLENLYLSTRVPAWVIKKLILKR